MTKPSVLIVSPFFRPNIGGVEAYLDDLCLYLAKTGHKVHVVTYQPLTSRTRAQKFESRHNIEIHRLSWFGHNWFHKLQKCPLCEFIYLTPMLFIGVMFFLWKNGKTVDVVHAQGLVAGFITMVLAPLFGKKAVISTCAVYDFKPKSPFARVARWVFSSFQTVLALGECSRRELAAIGVPENKIRVYRLWVDVDRYRPEDKGRAKSSIGLIDRFIVLFVGRFIRIKGVEVVLEAAERLTENITFCFIGDDGPLLNKVAEKANRLGHVKLIRGIRGDKLIPYYQAADVLVVPSLYDEAFGKVIIEALACGTPVIGTNRGFIPDVLDASVGRVIDPTVENMCREILSVYRHADQLQKWTMAARAYAVNNFGEQNAASVAQSYVS